MAIIFPIDCITETDKIEYLYCAREKLRLLHNQVGKWRREGLTRVEYDAIPEKIRDVLPSFTDSVKLSDGDFEKFFQEEFFLRDHEISKAATLSFNECKKSTRWNIKVEDI